MSGCKIRRPQLDRIFNLATEGFSPEAFIRIATERKAGELSSEVEATTIDALIGAVRTATLPGDPENIDNLQLVVSERGSVRSVSVMIDGHALGPKVEVSVVDEDAGWVRGRMGGLRALFTDTRNGWFIGHGRTRFYMAAAGFTAGLPVNVMVASLLPFVHTILARTVLFAGGLAILTSLFYVFGSWMDRRSRTELRLHEPRRARIDMGVWAIVVGIIGVLVAVISSLAAHHVFPPAHASGSNPRGARPGQTSQPPANPASGADPAKRGADPAKRGADPAPAADSQSAGPAHYPGLDASWALAGVSWAPAAYNRALGSEGFPGLGASLAQNGVSWAPPTGSP